MSVRPFILSNISKKLFLGIRNTQRPMPVRSLCTLGTDSGAPGGTCEGKTEDFLEDYTTEQRAEMLDVLNQSCLDDLRLKFRVARTVAERIMDHKVYKGEFTGLEELREVRGMKERSALVLCRKISRALSRTDTRTSRDRRAREIFYPFLTNDQMPESVTCVSLLNIDRCASLTWLRMTSDGLVHDWDREVAFTTSAASYDFHTHQKKMWNVVSKVPESERYLVQDLPVRPAMAYCRNEVFKYTSQARSEAVVATLLNRRVSAGESYSPRVHKIRYRAVSEHFGLDVGGRRVDSRGTVRAIGRGTCAQAPGVTLPPALLQRYLSSSRAAREHLSYPLLMAVTFYSLFSPRDPGGVDIPGGGEVLTTGGGSQVTGERDDHTGDRYQRDDRDSINEEDLCEDDLSEEEDD